MLLFAIVNDAVYLLQLLRILSRDGALTRLMLSPLASDSCVFAGDVSVDAVAELLHRFTRNWLSLAHIQSGSNLETNEATIGLYKDFSIVGTDFRFSEEITILVQAIAEVSRS